MTRAASRASAFVWIALSLVWLAVAGVEGETSEEEMEGKRWATPRRIATKSHRY